MSGCPKKLSEDHPEQGISLNELSLAFAKAMGESTVASQAIPASVERDGQETGAETSAEISPKTIFEAMLFVGNQDNQPLLPNRAAELMRGVEEGDIPALVQELNQRYSKNGCPYCIVSESGGYRLNLRKKFYDVKDRFYGRVRQARLSQAAIDVLAIVAYRQPLTGEEVSRLRDKSSSHILAQLVRRQLLRLERTKDRPRKVQYFTTERFLQLFGLSSIADLPQSEELENS